MPFFNREPQSADANTATAVGGSNAPAAAPASEKTGLRGLMSRRNRQANAQERATYGNDNLNARPRFGQWLKGIVFDVVVMFVMGAVGLGVGIALFLLEEKLSLGINAGMLIHILTRDTRSTSPHQLPLDRSQ